MALINPNTGSSKFNAVVRYNAVVSLAGEEPAIVSQEEEFGIKLLSDATNGEELSFKDLQEVPNEEIGEDGYWIHSQAARLKNMSQEELIALVLQLQGQGTEAPAQEPPAESNPEDIGCGGPIDGVVEDEEPAEKPKKKKKKRPVPVKDEEDEEEETEDVAF